jgi:hypothetical protein
VSTGGSRSGPGLLGDTSLSDLDTAWRERETESSALVAAGLETMALALRIYALEIRIKTFICKALKLDNLPMHCKTHDLAELLLFTGLWAELEDPANAAIRRHWDLLVQFSKDRLNNIRYLPAAAGLGKYDQKQLIEALDDPTSGVCPWLSRHP